MPKAKLNHRYFLGQMRNIMSKYWYLILQFQTDYLVFIRSLRKRNCKLFLNVHQSLVKWFFIFDQYNYARWISVHVQDLLTLKVTCHSDVICHSDVQSSIFTNAHEQCNKIIKSINGPINFVNRDCDIGENYDMKIS